MHVLAVIADALPSEVLPNRGFFEVLQPYGWVLAAGFVVALVMTPVMRAVALKLDVVDRPDSFLKPHGRPIPYLGGVAILVAWLARMLVVRYEAGQQLYWAIGISVGGVIIAAVGLADDIMDLKPWKKLLGQVLVAAVLLASGIGVDFVHIFLEPLGVQWPEWAVFAASVPLVVFVLVGACNAANLLDGLDGLCSGVTGIIALGFVVLSAYMAMWTNDDAAEALDKVRVVASIAMTGAVLGFLPYNAPPAKIFMGDAGSMLLGFFVAAMMLMFGASQPRWVLASGLIFGLPILDTSLALIRRVRMHRRIFCGDRSHLYDQLLERGFSVRQTLAIMYTLAVLYALSGLSIILLPSGMGRWGLAIVAAVALVTLACCWKWGFLWPRGPVKSVPQAAEAPGQDE